MFVILILSAYAMLHALCPMPYAPCYILEGGLKSYVFWKKEGVPLRHEREVPLDPIGLPAVKV